LTFSSGMNLRRKGPWIAVGAFGPSLFIRDFARSQIAWGVTSQWLILFLTFQLHSTGSFCGLSWSPSS
jgi:hypothetical protein